MSGYSFRELGSGEINGLFVVEVMKIPNQTIIYTDNKVEPDMEIVNGFRGILTECFQVYKNSRMTGANTELSLDLTWITEPVENQPYKANIRLFFIIRCICERKEEAENVLSVTQNIVRMHLSSMHYTFKKIEYEQLLTHINEVELKRISALVKDESIAQLNNQLFPFCYDFDVFGENTISLEYVANTLINYPNVILSIQLVATTYSEEEKAYINQITQSLNLLNNGIQVDPMTRINSPLAEKYSLKYGYYADYYNSDLYMFNIIAGGQDQSVDTILSSVYGHINKSSKKANMKIIRFDSARVDFESNYYPLPWAVNERLMQMDRNVNIWNSGYISNECYRLPYVITGDEATAFFRLPIGSEALGAGFKVDLTEVKSKSYGNKIINSGDVSVGTIKNTDNSIGIRINDLTKHGLIVGSPGSGKTTFSVGLMDRLWKEYEIPFLIIEPAKNEYRAMIESIPELQVFTPGKNQVSPFVFNPFVPPANVKLESYKSVLKTAFNAALALTSPLDKIVDDAINNTYSEFRWLNTYTTNDGGKYFNIDDFIKCFRETFEGIGYVGEATNIGRAGVVRFKGLKNLFDSYSTVSIEDLLTKPTVIELSSIENSEEKTLIILLILLSILSYVNANYLGEGQLKNVILLEEAHVLFDAGSSKSVNEANPAEMAISLVKRMLAEARAYGIGMLIADQSPRKVTADVVGLTDIKMTFRLVEEEDKTIIAESINMSDIQKNSLSRLRPGEAFFFYNKLDDPEEIKTPDYREDNSINVTISDKKLHELSSYWNDKEDLLRPYPECRCVMYCQERCDYSRRVLARDVAHRLFKKHFKQDDTRFDTVRNVFGQISNIIKRELNNEPFSHELLLCIKVHLWREIRYETKIPVNNKLILNSLRK